VARVAVDVPLAHLDRPFDYLVPATLDEAAVPGCRVRVRFAGRLTGGYLLERAGAGGQRTGAVARVEDGATVGVEDWAVVGWLRMASPRWAAVARRGGGLW